jgi:uncharacterized Zn-binding protein involved in type VI secretion
MTLPAARITDTITCPQCGPGVITSINQSTVLFGGLPVARITDVCFCVPPGVPIAKGAPGVLVQGLPIAHVLDPAGHGGHINLGLDKALIG